MEASQLIELILQLGVAGIGFAFFWDERKAHSETINKHREELRAMREHHMNDLREIAGIRSTMARVQTYARDSQKVPSNSEMIDVS